MRNQVLPRILRFFEGMGHAMSTPSGDARGHVYSSERQMYDLLGSDRFFGR